MSEWIAWVLEHRSVRYAVLDGLALLTTLAGWSAASLRVNGDMTALLKDEDPVVQAYEAVLHDLLELDTLVVLCDPDHSNTLDTTLRTEPGVASVIPWSIWSTRTSDTDRATTPPSDITRTRETLKRIRERTRMKGVHCVFGGVPHSWWNPAIF